VPPGRIGVDDTGPGSAAGCVGETDARPWRWRPLWSAGQVSWRQRAIAPSSRCRARRAGFGRLHWSVWHQRPTGTGGEETPNATSMTAAMRPQGQSWPRQPSAAAPRCHSAGRRASWSAANRPTAPGGGRWERVSGPPSRAHFIHGLTAASLTPKAAAIWRWDQPLCLSRQVCKRRTSGQLVGERFMPGSLPQKPRLKGLMSGPVVWRCGTSPRPPLFSQRTPSC
jgi:hypothetical protein